MIQANILELFWLLTCLAGVLTTGLLLAGALQERFAYLEQGDTDPTRQLARLLVLSGNQRRELLRLITQLLLLFVVVPSLFRPGDVALVFDLSTAESIQRTLGSLAVLALITVPPTMLINSLLDARQNRRLRDMSEVWTIQTVARLVADGQARLEESLTSIHEKADATIEKADAAYSEANHANVKIAELQQALLEERAERQANE